MNTGAAGCGQTANDRFKREFSRWVWCGVLLAAAFHYGLFQFFPALTVRDLRGDENKPVEVVPLPPLDLPPPPDRILRPPVPVVGPMDLDEDITIHPTTWDENPIAPPPPARGDDRVGHAGFTVYTVPPRVKDRVRALRIVRRHYPRTLERAGVEGSVTLQAYIDTTGRVLDARLVKSSGSPQLDVAAYEAVLQFEFTPALNRDQKVAVWVEQVITFKVR